MATRKALLANVNSEPNSSSKQPPKVVVSKGASSRYVHIMPMVSANPSSDPSSALATSSPDSKMKTKNGDSKSASTNKSMPHRSPPLIAPNNASSARQFQSRSIPKLHPIAPKPPSSSQSLPKNCPPIVTSTLKQKKKIPSNLTNTKSGPAVKDSKQSKTKKNSSTSTTKNGINKSTNPKQSGDSSNVLDTKISSTKSDFNHLNPLFLDSVPDITSPPVVFSSIDPSSLTNLTPVSTMSSSPSSHKNANVDCSAFANTATSDHSTIIPSSSQFGSKMLPASSQGSYTETTKPLSFSHEPLLDGTHLFSPPTSPFFFSSLSADPLIPTIPSFSAAQPMTTMPSSLSSQSMLPFQASLSTFDSEMLAQDSGLIKNGYDSKNDFGLLSKSMFISPSATLNNFELHDAFENHGEKDMKKDLDETNNHTRAQENGSNVSPTATTKSKGRSKSRSKCDTAGSSTSIATGKISKSTDPASKLLKSDRSHRLNAPVDVSPTNGPFQVKSPSPTYDNQTYDKAETGSAPDAVQPLAFQPIDLDNNPDYIALTSALSLLQTQRTRARNDIVQLNKLKTEALADPTRFVTELKKTGHIQNAPEMQAIVRTPLISWNQYGLDNQETKMLEYQIRKGIVEHEHPPFSQVRLFDHLMN